MSRIYLPEPGAYTGTDGQLEYEDGESVAVTAFRVDELQDGGRLSADLQLSRRILGALVGASSPPVRFRGRTLERTDLLLEGLFAPEEYRFDGYPAVKYRCSGSLQVVVDDAPREAKLTVLAEIQNLSFSGAPPNDDDAGLPPLHSRDALRFSVDGRQVEILRSANYAAILAEMGRSRTSGPTAQLAVGATNQAALNDTRGLIDVVCELLTLATGTHVAWGALHVRDQERQWWTRHERHDAPLMRFVGGSGLIGRRSPLTVRTFIEAAYPNMVKHRTDLDLRAVIRSYAEGLSAGFLETKTLTMAVIAEYLATRVLRGRDVRTDKMSLGRRVMKASEVLNAGLEPLEVSAFVKARNDLAHGMAFPKASEDYATLTTNYDWHLAVRYVVDRLLMGILDYQGPFMDCRTGKPVRPEGEK